MKAEENQPEIMTIDDVFKFASEFHRRFIVESFELDVENGRDITVAFRIAS